MTRAHVVLLLLLPAWLPAQQRADLLVQGAIDDELQPLLAALDSKRETNLGAWTFWTGHIGSKSVVISRTEVGPLNAAAATALGIQAFHPAAILNQGTCGTHNRELAVFDIVLGAKAIDYSAFRSSHAAEGAGTDPRRWTQLHQRLRLDNRTVTFFPEGFAGDRTLLGAAMKVKYTHGKLVEGNLGSAFQYNRELDRLRWLRQTYATDTEDMESAFAAGVAAGMKVPFLAIRIVSDNEWTHPTMEHIAGEYCARFTLDLVRSLP